MSETLDHEEIPIPPPEKPTSLKVLQAIMWVKVIGMLLVIVTLLIASVIDTTQDHIFAKFMRGFAANFGSNGNITAYELGFITGQFLLPLTLSIIVLISVKHRKFIAASIALSFSLLLGIGSGASFILALVCLLLLLTRKSKAYMKYKPNFLQK